MNRGVYFLANDGVIDLAIAFLNSFRKHNPDIPLCLIPFNMDFEQLRELRHKYRFSIYSNGEILARCDEISVRFHKQVLGHYRKLAIWEGDFDQFIYIDVDTVVLRNIEFAFPFLSRFDFVTSHSNTPDIVKWVWKPSIYSAGRLTEEQIAFSANTGFIMSKKRALTLETVTPKLADALSLASHMVLFCKEQPLLNYLIVTSDKKYTSLLNLSLLWRSSDILLEAWAGLKGGIIKDGQVLLPNGTSPPLFLIHWAGKYQPRFLDKLIFFILRKLRIRGKNDRLVVRFFMPYRKLWEYYRFLI